MNPNFLLNFPYEKLERSNIYDIDSFITSTGNNYFTARLDPYIAREMRLPARSNIISRMSARNEPVPTNRQVDDNIQYPESIMSGNDSDSMSSIYKEPIVHVSLQSPMTMDTDTDTDSDSSPSTNEPDYNISSVIAESRVNVRKRLLENNDGFQEKRTRLSILERIYNKSHNV